MVSQAGEKFCLPRNGEMVKSCPPDCRITNLCTENRRCDSWRWRRGQQKQSRNQNRLSNAEEQGGVTAGDRENDWEQREGKEEGASGDSGKEESFICFQKSVSHLALRFSKPTLGFFPPNLLCSLSSPPLLRPCVPIRFGEENTWDFPTVLREQT